MNDFMKNCAAATLGACIVLYFGATVAENFLPSAAVQTEPAAGQFSAAMARELEALPNPDLVRVLCDQMATSLEFDGKQVAPVVTTTAQVGEKFQALQRFRLGAESPFGETFPAVEALFASEVQKRLSLGATSKPLTPELRAAAVALFREVSVAK